MTVQDLIDELEGFDGDLDVLISRDKEGSYFSDVYEIVLSDGVSGAEERTIVIYP